jgi:hypothetical protein
MRVLLYGLLISYGGFMGGLFKMVVILVYIVFVGGFFLGTFRRFGLREAFHDGLWIYALCRWEESFLG